MDGWIDGWMDGWRGGPLVVVVWSRSLCPCPVIRFVRCLFAPGEQEEDAASFQPYVRLARLMTRLVVAGQAGGGVGCLAGVFLSRFGGIRRGR